MNWGHLWATLWLRWRILANRVRRAGKLSNILFVFLIVLGSVASIGAFVLAMGIGYETLQEYERLPFLAVWCGLALGFVFFWMIGLLTDLQRSDAMSFKNLLHLPVSLKWVFLYNYLSSFVSVSIALFLPAMLGATVAMVMVGGPRMLLALPLVFGYFGMITALTYQLRGWLARLMEDKRRGRNVVALITVLFVLLIQIPNFINLRAQSSPKMTVVFEPELSEPGEDPEAARAAAEQQLEELRAQEEAEELEFDRMLTTTAQILPIGWLPYGLRETYDGRWWIGILCSGGLLGIAALSLRRSYRTTVLASVGGDTVAARPVATAAKAAETGRSERAKSNKTPLVERDLRGVDGRAAAIAFANLQALLRAPEAKMVLLSPVILFVVFGAMLAGKPSDSLFHSFAPMMSLGAIAMSLLSIIQLIQNQFGLDREGFRAFVLCPVPRDRILLGKNLAVAPIGIGIGLIALAGLQLLTPTGVTHFIGSCFQLVSAYLLICLVGNMISIMGPVRLKEHTLKAANAQWKTFLWQLASILLLPIVLSPLLVPSLIELATSQFDWARAVPLFPILHAVGSVLTLLLYRWLLPHQGELLQSREQRILDMLTRD